MRGPLRGMYIEHVAIWTKDLERLRSFYETYFGARSGDKYVNPDKRFVEAESLDFRDPREPV